MCGCGCVRVGVWVSGCVCVCVSVCVGVCMFGRLVYICKSVWYIHNNTLLVMFTMIALKCKPSAHYSQYYDHCSF